MRGRHRENRDRFCSSSGDFSDVCEYGDGEYGDGNASLSRIRSTHSVVGTPQEKFSALGRTPGSYKGW